MKKTRIYLLRTVVFVQLQRRQLQQNCLFMPFYYYDTHTNRISQRKHYDTYIEKKKEKKIIC